MKKKRVFRCVLLALLVPGLLYAWPCQTSYTTFSQSLTSLNGRCDSPIHLNAIMLKCGEYHQTTDYTCGPAAVMTLMHCFGMLESREMNSRTEMRIASEMGVTEGRGGGTTPGQVASWLEAHGFVVESGVRVTADLIIGNVKRGIPTLLAFSNHWMLADGYNPGRTPDQDEIIFTDPGYNINIMSRDVVDSMWEESQVFSTSFTSPGVYIVAVPRK